MTAQSRSDPIVLPLPAGQAIIFEFVHGRAYVGALLSIAPLWRGVA